MSDTETKHEAEVLPPLSLADMISFGVVAGAAAHPVRSILPRDVLAIAKAISDERDQFIEDLQPEEYDIFDHFVVASAAGWYANPGARSNTPRNIVSYAYECTVARRPPPKEIVPVAPVRAPRSTTAVAAAGGGRKR